MSDKEIRLIVSTIRQNGKRTTASKQASEKFLKRIGVLNKEGKVKMAYRDICIPIDQD